jgi:hypothetical protein
MSSFYKCLRGDNEHLGLFEAEAFVVHDGHGQPWICFPLSAAQVEGMNLAAHVADVHAADACLEQHGLGAGGTEVRIIYCEEQEELPLRLG